jgi:hypothetical protein
VSVEVTCFALDRLHFGISDNVYVFVGPGLNQFRREDAHSAVVCRERLIQLRHPAADAWLLFYEKDLDAHLCQVQRRLNTGYPTPNNHDLFVIHS